jgi:hypothetical protein
MVANFLIKRVPQYLVDFDVTTDYQLSTSGVQQCPSIPFSAAAAKAKFSKQKEC